MENKKYMITNTSERVAVEERSTSIDNDGKYYSNYFVEFSNGKVIIDETINTMSEKTHTEFDISEHRDYWNSDTANDIENYFEKNNIKYRVDDEVDYIIHNSNGYGIEYTHYYENLTYYCDLSEKQIEELEDLGWEIEENSYLD